MAALNKNYRRPMRNGKAREKSKVQGQKSKVVWPFGIHLNGNGDRQSERRSERRSEKMGVRCAHLVAHFVAHFIEFLKDRLRESWSFWLPEVVRRLPEVVVRG